VLLPFLFPLPSVGTLPLSRLLRASPDDEESIGDSSPSHSSLPSSLLTEDSEDEGFNGDGATGIYEDRLVILAVDGVLRSWVELEPLLTMVEAELSRRVAPDDETCDRISAESLSTPSTTPDLPACDVPPTSSISRPLLGIGGAFFKGGIGYVAPKIRKSLSNKSDRGVHILCPKASRLRAGGRNS
jgi:hypothetical protein